jgi:uncharacterized protein YndB with AHSA1/START domain
MTTGTVSLHRVLRASPEKVYRAFTTSEAMASWLPPYGFTCKVHSMDVKVGGNFKMYSQISQLIILIHLEENI